LTLGAAAARAQTEDKAAARVLFEEGKKLVKEGRYTEGCAKLEGAAKAYNSAGILLNLADCYEKSGRTASAWTQFGEAAAVGKRTGRSVEAAEAGRRLEQIQSRLTSLVVRVPTSVPDMAVMRDGVDVPQAAWGTAIPVDPGSHEIRAQAPGFEGWVQTVDVNGAGQTVSVEIPQLRRTPAVAAAAAPEPGKAPPSTAPPVPDESTPASHSRSTVLEWTLIGAGGAVAIAGTTLMLVESNRANSARQNDDPAAYESTKTPYWVGVGGVIAGGATLVTGIVLLAAGHGESSSTGKLRVSPWAAATGGGLQVGGMF
jgi:hypothetical protein